MLIPFRKKTLGSRGFTLVELLVAALMGAILLAATAGLVVQVLRIDREETGRSEVQADQSLAMDFIARDLAEAVFIYNDTFSATLPVTDPARFATPDGIPDMNQLLYDPKWIKQPPDSVPVLAFWKLEPIPLGCYVDGTTIPQIDAGLAALKPAPPTDAMRPSITVDDWNTVTNRRSIYVLVVYYLRRNYNDAGNIIDTAFEGNARITRYTLTPFNGDCTQRNAFFDADPDPFLSTFLEWREPPVVGQVPAQPNDPSDPTTVASNIFSSYRGVEFAIKPDTIPVSPPPGEEDQFCSRYGTEQVGGEERAIYTLGGVKPAPPPTTIPALTNGFADQGFYACVRRAANANQPQDVILHITTTALQRANPGIFNRYLQNPASFQDPVTNTPDLTLGSYLNTLETRVLARGALSRTVS